MNILKPSILYNIIFQSKEIKENVAKYIKQIADVLAFVNRQMILIFKTNDLLRTIEHNLGTSNRYCIKILALKFVKNYLYHFFSTFSLYQQNFIFSVCCSLSRCLDRALDV